MDEHFNRCKEHVLRRADEMAVAIKSGRMNGSAFEGLLRSYIDQPAFYPQDREELFARGYERIVGRRPTTQGD